MSAIITRTLQSGKSLSISVETATRHPNAVVSVDGKEVGRNIPFGKPGEYRIVCNGNAVLPITDAEYKTIKAAIEAAKTAPSLEEQRSRLVSAIADALEEQENAFSRGHNSDGSSAYNAKAGLQPKVDATRAALKEFDAAHPEIAEQVRRQAETEAAKIKADHAESFAARGLD